MRVARGMFRLWLVLSCLWIATVAAIAYSSWPSSTVQQAATSNSKTYVPEYMKDASKDPKADDSKTYVPEWAKDQDPNNSKTSADDVLPLCKDVDPNNFYADFCRLGTPSRLFDPAREIAEALKGDAVNAQQQSAQQLAVTTAKLALIPPALIFIVGIGLTWAFRGFRHS